MACTISLDNISSSEIVSYPLVLIKGSVISSGLSLPDGITVNSVRYPLTYSKFKCLLELDLGENTFEFTCQSSKLLITLVYSPRKSELKVRPLYIICDGHDGCFQAPKDINNDAFSACRRIDTCCKLLQTILAEKLHEGNFGRKTFALKKCEIFKSQLKVENAKALTQDELWSSLGREIMSSNLASDKMKYLGFLSCTKYNGDKYSEEMKSHKELLDITDVYVALGGGGLGIFGTGSLYTWPEEPKNILDCFRNDTKVDKTKFLDDSAYRGTLGACFSTTIGSVLHELCHTFDLGHTDIGIMGRGFDNIQNIFLDYTNANRENSMPSGKDDIVSIKVKDVDSKCFIRQVEFPEEVLNKPICIDDTCFTKSSSSILAYHKWFNDYDDDSKGFILSYDKNYRLVKSTLGIRVIEIRRLEDEMVMKNWCFVGKILKYNFQIVDILDVDVATVFVEDNNGNILKTNL